MLIQSAENRLNETLGQLSEDDRESLISLPYRVGMYISQCDTSGGDESEEAERQTLNRILIEISQDFCKSEFIQKILNESATRQDRWATWGTKVNDVPKDCTHFADKLSMMIEVTDLRSFKETLIDIGQAVAMAYREDQETQDTESSKFSKMMRSLMGKKPDPFVHPNISKKERKALHEIAKALSWQGLE